MTALDLATYGWDDEVARLVADREGEVGRIVRVDHGAVNVVTAAGERTVTISGKLKAERDPVAKPAIGDWIELDDTGVIAEVLPRRSSFLRGDISRLRAQVVAANVDVVFVVHSAEGEANVRRLERELVLAYQSGAQPVVVISKADKVADPGPAVEALRASAPGVDVVVTSARGGRGIPELARYGVGHRTLAFIGASGVGKSSLINALLGDARQAVGETREYDGKGRHTTTVRAIFPLDGGGLLVDTPGLRSVGMWRSDEGLAAAFADIEEHARECKFSDCTHDHEPDCAVRAGIDPARLAHWRELHTELDALDAEAEARGRVVEQQDRSRARQ